MDPETPGFWVLKTKPLTAAFTPCKIQFHYDSWSRTQSSNGLVCQHHVYTTISIYLYRSYHIYTHLVGDLEHDDFPYIGNVIIPSDFHSIIFQRGRSTTNQTNSSVVWRMMPIRGKIHKLILATGTQKGASPVGYSFFTPNIHFWWRKPQQEGEVSWLSNGWFGLIWLCCLVVCLIRVILVVSHILDVCWFQPRFEIIPFDTEIFQVEATIRFFIAPHPWLNPR